MDTRTVTGCNYTYMLITGTGTNGWYLNSFKVWQKVNGGVYTYVSPRMYGMYCAQLYIRGTASICSLEARTVSYTTNVSTIFSLAESWLVKYSDGDHTKIRTDFYSINNPTGAWSSANAVQKLYYVDTNAEGNLTR